MTMRMNILSALAIAMTLTAATLVTTSDAHAGIHGGTPVKNKRPIVNAIHPIVYHPVHGPGSSHNPIVVSHNCDNPTTLCRRP
jgi:hypothetical protein